MPTINSANLTLTTVGQTVTVNVTFNAVFTPFERQLAGLGLKFHPHVDVWGMDPPRQLDRDISHQHRAPAFPAHQLCGDGGNRRSGDPLQRVEAGRQVFTPGRYRRRGCRRDSLPDSNPRRRNAARVHRRGIHRSGSIARLIEFHGGRSWPASASVPVAPAKFFIQSIQGQHHDFLH